MSESLGRFKVENSPGAASLDWKWCSHRTRTVREFARFGMVAKQLALLIR